MSSEPAANDRRMQGMYRHDTNLKCVGPLPRGLQFKNTERLTFPVPIISYPYSPHVQ